VVKISEKYQTVSEIRDVNMAFNQWKENAQTTKIDLYYWRQINDAKKNWQRSEVFNLWKLNVEKVGRKREQASLKTALLKKIIQKVTFASVQKSFRKWRGPAVNGKYVQDMRKDFV
jgi:hypothetical protein